MTMRRRIFLKSLASTLALTSLAAKKSNPNPVFDPNLVSVLMGPSFDGQAEFSVVHNRNEPLRYLVYRGLVLVSDVLHTSIVSEVDDFKIDKFLIYNLPVDTDLILKVLSHNGQLIDERIFSTISSSKSDLSIGIASCMRAAEHDKSMWDSLERKKPDLLLFVGDTVYVDYNREGEISPSTIWRKFVETRMVLQFYQWKRLVPVISIWDDHDHGGDNTGVGFKYTLQSQSNFKNFFAQSLSEKSFINAGPGVSCSFQLGDQLFLMLDGRSFREAPESNKLYSMFWQRTRRLEKAQRRE